MANENEGGDIEVVLQDDAAAAAAAAAATGKDVQPPDAGAKTDVADGVEELRRKLAESEQQRTAERQRAEAAEQRAHSATSTVHDSQMAVLNSALDTLNANKTALQGAYAEALSNGDFDKAAEINTQLTENSVQRVEIARGKAALEARVRTAPQVAAADDPVEHFARQLLPRAAAWIRAHPDFVTDKTKNSRMLAEHYRIVADGIEEGSDAYFQRIEQGLGLTTVAPTAPPAAPAGNGTGTGNGTMSGAAAPVQRRDVQPSPAPASRGGGGRTIRLTQQEQEAARISGMTNEEYGKHLAAERAKGTINKSVH